MFGHKEEFLLFHEKQSNEIGLCLDFELYRR